MLPSSTDNNGVGNRPPQALWPAMEAGNVREALQMARQAQPAWAAQSLPQRLKVVRRLRHNLARQPERLAQGVRPVAQRTLAETLVAEVLPLLEACRFLEREATQILAPNGYGDGDVLRGYTESNSNSPTNLWASC